jgi:SAM-dependent methyltransferase
MSTPWRGDLDVGFRALDEVTSLDEARISLFREYLAREYAGPFIDGMGSAEILGMVRRFLCQGRRLDVGCGTASLFWMLAAVGDVLTTAADVEPEALAVLREFLSAPSPLPDCYYQAAGLFGVPAARVDTLRRSIDSFLVFNALGTWPDELTRSRYDSVTAFGCFAISGSEPTYQKCFQSAALAVRAGGGRMIGADWIRHQHLQTRDYSFVTTGVLRRIGVDLGLRVLHLEDVDIVGDETYGSVVLWAFEKP